MAQVNVHELYQQLLIQGKSPKDAAREAQERTGIALVTGRPIRKNPPDKKVYSGQYK